MYTNKQYFNLLNKVNKDKSSRIRKNSAGEERVRVECIGEGKPRENLVNRKEEIISVERLKSEWTNKAKD